MKRFLCLTIFLVFSAITANAQTITVNGQSSGASVASAAYITVAVSGGGGTGYDTTAWMAVCTASGPYSVANCDWPYAGVTVNNCGIWAGGSTVVAANTCSFTAPVQAGNYVAAFFPNHSNYTPLATAPFSVTGGFTGGGTGCSDLDSGVGASLGLVCQAALSDDFNGTAIDTNKWDIRWSPTEGNGYAVVPNAITSNGGTWGEFATKALLPAGRPAYIEARIRFQGSLTGWNHAVWMWGCDAVGSSSSNAICYGAGANNLPEIDLSEIGIGDGQHQCIHIHLWAGGGFSDHPFSACPPGSIGNNIEDGNWHTLGVRLDPNPTPYGTVYFYQDGNLLTSWTATAPYYVFPEQGSLGLGYQFILSLGCTGNCQSLVGSTEQDVDYVHVYQGQSSSSCTIPNNNASFRLSGNVVSSINSLSAGTYTIAPTVMMSQASNSGACFPVMVTAATSGGSGGPPTITVNGSSSGTTVNPGASMTVAVANGPGNPLDFIQICTGTPCTSGNHIVGAWVYISGCSQNPPGMGLTANTCPLTAPVTPNNYYVGFEQNDVFNELVSAPITVSSGGPGPGGGGTCTTSVATSSPVPCPVGVTPTSGFHWNLTYDDEFTQDSGPRPEWSMQCQYFPSGVDTDPNNWEWVQGIGGCQSVGCTYCFTYDATNGFGMAAENVLNRQVARAQASNLDTQKFGFWEFSVKRPFNINGEGDGVHTDTYLVRSGTSTYSENDINEAVNGPSNMGYVNWFYEPFDAGAQLQYPSPPYPASLANNFHTYGVWWRDDGTPPNGSAQPYFDGVAQGSPHQIDKGNNTWALGAVVLMIEDACTNDTWGGSVPCGSRIAPVNPDPYYTRYMRRWQLMAN